MGRRFLLLIVYQGKKNTHSKAWVIQEDDDNEKEKKPKETFP